MGYRRFIIAKIFHKQKNEISESAETKVSMEKGLKTAQRFCLKSSIFVKHL